MKKDRKTSVSFGQTIKKQFGSSQFKNGSYSLAMIAVVLVIVILVNLIVGQLPKSVTAIDISSSLIYETGEVTEEVVSSLEHDVDILVIAENDSVDQRIESFLERYAELSSHISLSHRDPVLHPDVLTEYGVSANTIVVSCEDTQKTTTVSIGDMIQYNEYYLYQGAYVESGFDGEGLMTSAISYVAADDAKTVYMLNGHQEASLSDSVSDLLKKSNLTTAELNLMDTTSVPEDCGLLLVNAPQVDLADDELTAIRSYLISGGSIMLLRGVTQKDLPNFDALMEEYGLVMVNNYVGDTERFYQNAGSYFNFFPVIAGSSLNVSSDSLILVTTAAGMQKAENTDSGVSVETLLSTSSKAGLDNAETADQQYLIGAKSVKTYEAGETAERTEDADSPLIQGDETAAQETEEETATQEEITTEEETATEEEITAKEETATEEETTAKEETTTEEETATQQETTAEEETGTEEAGSKEQTEAESDAQEQGTDDTTEGTLLVLTAPSMIDSGITDRFSNLENLNEFMNLVASCFDDVENISIPAKSLEVPYNTVTGAGIWNSLFLFIIPAFCIITGLYVWIRRRKA